LPGAHTDAGVNLRTHLQRIIRKAGLEPWPKLFQNLRSTRETELAEQFPIHVVCRWIGNSQPVAARHYLQLTDEHFARAITDDGAAGTETVQNAAQKAHETPRNEPKRPRAANAKTPAVEGVCESDRSDAGYFDSLEVGQRGLEPPTSPLSGVRSSQLSY
jgi:hypothetical protein